MERQIERDSNKFDIRVDTSTAENSSGLENERIDELLARVTDIQTELGDLNENVGKATDAVHAQQGVDPELTPSVYEVLPEGEENAHTVEEIARSIGRKDAAVRFALENLRKNTGTVKKVTPLQPHEDQSEDVEAGYEEGVILEPRWYRVEGA